MAGMSKRPYFSALQGSWAAALWCCCWIQSCALVRGQHLGSASRFSSAWLWFRWRAWRPGCTCCPAVGATWATTTKGAAHADTAIAPPVSASMLLFLQGQVLPVCWDVNVFVTGLTY